MHAVNVHLITCSTRVANLTRLRVQRTIITLQPHKVQGRPTVQEKKFFVRIRELVGHEYH